MSVSVRGVALSRASYERVDAAGEVRSAYDTK